MNTQHLETQEEPKEQTYSPVLTPESPATTQEVAAHQLPTEAEVQQAFEKMQRKRGGFRSGRRSGFGCRNAAVTDPIALKNTPIEEVLTILREEGRKRTKRKRLFIGIFLGMIALFAAISVLTHSPHLFNSMGSYIGFISMGAAVSMQQKAAIMALSTRNDVRAVGPLAETLEMQDKVSVQYATQNLIGLLPQMKASDAHLLSPDQRACLNRALRGKNFELTLAILKAWEQVGDTKAIEEVEKLALGRGRGGRNPKVVEAAKDCLPFLRQSAERQQVGSQLLRAADGNLTPSDVLLRAAMPHVSTEPADQLLRPTSEA